MNGILPLDRFLSTLDIVAREGAHLAFSRGRLFAERIDTAWVEALPDRPELAERMEAFVSRYGRMQDTMADKLLPRWLLALAERPGSQIETLNRAERLGVLASAEGWLEARNLRNRLVHEYMTDAGEFARNLVLAGEYSGMLIDTYNRLRVDAMERLQLEPTRLPAALDLNED
jgi:hypothetical protein